MSVAQILEVRNVERTFASRRSLADMAARRQPRALQALDGVSLSVGQGAGLGIVGESGCGKSTLARCIVGIDQPTSGEIRLDGEALGKVRTSRQRRRMQIVFQDPYSSLNPRMTVGGALSEALSVHRMCARGELKGRVAGLLEMVGLPPGIAGAWPSQLSGGQRQRVSIARALAPEPEILVADEPVSALDVSVQATVLNLLTDLRARLGLTLVLISHALGVVQYLCDRVAVMYLGRVVEEGPTAEIFANPRHPYTRALLAAAPRIGDDGLAGPAATIGEPPSPYDLPTGCRFHPRCPIATSLCRQVDPPLAGLGLHTAACHFAFEESGA